MLLGRVRRRARAISPIVATVLIVAVTLVASVAIAGFIFGIFSTTADSAQVAVTANILKQADEGGAAATSFTCGAVGTFTSYATLTNTGTAQTSVTSMTITWAGQSNTFTVSGSCTVGAAGSATATQNLLIGKTGTLYYLATAPTVGGTYTGTVTLASGATVLFTGPFQ